MPPHQLVIIIDYEEKKDHVETDSVRRAQGCLFCLNTIFTLRGGGRGYLKIVARFANSFGGCGLQPGHLRTKTSTRQLPHLTILTL
jgi:hypothetical protein